MPYSEEKKKLWDTYTFPEGFTKKCGECKKNLPPDQFRKNRNHKYGLQRECKECRNKYDSNRYWNNREEQLADRRERIRGVSKEQYDKLLASQNHCCAICGQHCSEFSKALAVDHDHITKDIRGLLCETCNRGLGLLHEDISILNKAIEYLLRDPTGLLHK